jgi:site-specific DNA recombinase
MRKYLNLKQLTNQKKKIETQFEKLEVRFAIGEIDQYLYQKYTQKFSDEIGEIEQKIDFGKNGSSNLENVINKATKISKTLSKTCKNMPFDQKVELQKIVFPKGTTYDKENKRVRTPEVNLLFELTKRNSAIYDNKKSGILTQNEMDSALVGNEGLEPPTSSL